MRKSFLATALFVAVPFALGMPTSECVPDPGSLDVCFDVDVTGAGFPPGSTVVPGSVMGCEDDTLTPDDPLGAGTYDSASDEVCIEISNTNGRLSGPNGTGQNGGAEGDCIEVFVKYKVQYQVEVCPADGNGPCWNEWREGDIETVPTEVCPC